MILDIGSRSVTGFELGRITAEFPASFHPATPMTTSPIPDPDESLSFAENGFGDRYIYKVNREAFNKLGSHAVLEAFFGKPLFAEHTLHIIVGTDSGLLLRHLAAQELPSGSRYLFIELPEVLAALQTEGLLDLLGDRGAYVTAEHWVEQALAFKINEYFYINNVEFWQSIAAREANVPEYTEVVWSVDAELNRLRWLGMTDLGNEAFIHCQLANLADNLTPATILKNAFRGKTAVLLAGGPSLDATIPWILEHRQKLAVLAVSRIARRLRQVGLQPDMVFSVDPTELSFDVSKEMLEFDDHVALIHSYHITPLLLGQWRGPSFYLGELLPWKSDLNRASLNAPGPTVTNTALSVAHALGFSRIVLAGVDLCFSKEGHTHAQGSNERQVGPRFDLTGLQVKTNGGWMADTSPDFKQALLSLELQCKRITACGDCELINPSADSAFIADVSHRPLDQIALTDEVADTGLTLDRYRSAATPADRLRHIDKVLREIRKGIHNAKGIRQLAEEALEHNEGIYAVDADNPRASGRAKINLDKVERQLNTRYRLFARMTKKLGIRDFLKVTRPFDDEELDAESAKRLGAVYYEAYRDGAVRLLKLLDSTEQRLLARAEEEHAKPDFDLLVRQWRRDRQPGRGRVWRERHPEVTIDADHLVEFATLEDEFFQTQTTSGSKHLERAKQHSSLSSAQRRARILLKNRQLPELEGLLSNLAHHPEADQSPLLQHLVSGYAAELHGHYEEALSEFAAIIDAGPSVYLEDALVRIFLISVELQNLDNAGFALECLSQLTPSYLPQYAEILRLQDRPLDAIDMYTRYIQQFPEEVFVQLRLARLFLDLEIVDSCRMLLQHVLERWPENRSAAELNAILGSKVSNSSPEPR